VVRQDEWHIIRRQLVRIKKGLQPPVIEVGNLKPKRAFLDASDRVRGSYVAALKGKPGETYNLCAANTLQVGCYCIWRSVVWRESKNSCCRPLMRPSEEKIIFESTKIFNVDTGWKPRSLEQTLVSMLKDWEGVV
jgi:GDP-4-dehydro-6-deoxy-D-mannose reductase